MAKLTTADDRMLFFKVEISTLHGRYYRTRLLFYIKPIDAPKLLGFGLRRYPRSANIYYESSTRTITAPTLVGIQNLSIGSNELFPGCLFFSSQICVCLLVATHPNVFLEFWLVIDSTMYVVCNCRKGSVFKWSLKGAKSSRFSVEVVILIYSLSPMICA